MCVRARCWWDFEGARYVGGWWWTGDPLDAAWGCVPTSPPQVHGTYPGSQHCGPPKVPGTPSAKEAGSLTPGPLLLASHPKSCWRRVACPKRPKSRPSSTVLRISKPPFPSFFRSPISTAVQQKTDASKAVC